jgi:hypothetical protein
MRRARACLMGVAIAGAFAVQQQTANAAGQTSDIAWSATPGSNIWSTTAPNWNGPTSWVNTAPYSGAVFNTSSIMSINVTEPVSVSSIDLQVTGYNISGSPISFGTGSSSLTGLSGASTASGGFSGIVDVTGTNAITYNSAEIDSNINSTVGFKKEGNGLLILGGALNITGSYPLTGNLNYTSGAYALAGGFAAITSNLAVGATTPNGTSPSTTPGGILRLGPGASLPATTSVSVGDGLLDLGAQNVTIAALTFPNSASVYSGWTNGSSDTLVGGYGNGVIGTGTLTVTGDIDVIQGGSAKNTIQANLNIGSGTQVIRLGSSSTSAGLLLSGNLSGTGALTVVPGYNTAGGIVNVISQYGNLGLFGNNTNTGPMTFDTGVVSITGTNAASALTISNAAVVQLMGASGSVQGAGTITIANNGTLQILNDTAAPTSYSTVGNKTGSAAAAYNSDRINDSANIVLRDGTLTYNIGTGANCTETFGNLSALGGANTINMNTNSGSAFLTGGTLTMGPGATLLVTTNYPLGSGFATDNTNTGAQLLFNTVTDSVTGTTYNTSSTSTPIIPRIITYNAKNQNYDLAFYNAGSGQLQTYTGYNPTANNFSGDAQLTATTGGVTSGTVNSLRINQPNGYTFYVSFDANQSTLNISSGMILVNQGYAVFQGSTGKTAGGGSGGGTINFGSATGVITGNNGNSARPVNGSTSGYYVTSYLPITGTGGLIDNGPGLLAYGSMAGLTGGITVTGNAYSTSSNTALNLYEGSVANGSTSTYCTPSPIYIRTGVVSILYNTAIAGMFIEPTGLGDVTLGEPENDGNLVDSFGSSAGPSAALFLTGVGGGGTTANSGSVFTRNINFNNGGGTNAGAALTPALAQDFPEVLTTSYGTSELLSGNIHLYSPGRFYGGATAVGYNAAGATLSGNISGPSILAMDGGTFNLTGNLQTTGPIWIGPGSAASVSFAGNATASTSPIIGYGGSRKSTLAYNGPNSLPNSSITVSNLNISGGVAQSNGMNDFSIRPLVTGTSISNTININSDLTFNAATGVVATWAGQLTGSSALYVASGILNIPSTPGVTNTFNGPLNINGSNAVVTLTPGALTPSVINVNNNGTLAIRGTTTQAINVSGGILYPGYNVAAGQATLTLPSTTIFGSTGTVELNLLGAPGNVAVSDELVFTGTTGPALGGFLYLNYSNNTFSNPADIGDTYTLFNFSSGLPTSTFGVPLNLPTLASGLVWNTGSLYTTGQISIQAAVTGTEAWSNAAGGTWETASNWTPNAIPGGYGTVETFGDLAGATQPITVTLTQGESSGQLVFSGSSTNYVLTGSDLTMYNTSSIPAAINISAGAQTINNNVSFGSAGLSVNTGSGSLTLGGRLVGNGPLTLTGPVSFGGIVNDSGALNVSAGSVINFTGTGTSTIASANYSTSTIVNLTAGTLNSGYNAGSGSVLNVGSGAIMTVNSSAQTGFNLSNVAINVSGTLNIGANTSAGAVNNVTSPVLNGSSAVLTVNSGASTNIYGGLTLKNGAKLVDNGSFSDGYLYFLSGTFQSTVQTVTLNPTTSLSVGSGAQFLGNLTMSNNSTATFAANTATGINIVFQKSLSMAAGVFTGGVQTAAPSTLTLNVSSGSSNRSLLLLGNGSSTLNGHIDLGNGDMADDATSQLSTLWTELQRGYNGGAWNGSNSTSGSIASAAAASDATHLHALGIMLNDTTGNTGTASGIAIYTNFDNLGTNNPYNASNNTLGASTELIKYTYYGDANLDGQVNSADYTLIDNGFLSSKTGWYNGDFNYDGVVNGSDYTLIDNAFNMQGAQISSEIASPTAQIGGVSAVPEPASLGVLGIGAVGLLSRRRRRR